MANVMDIAVDGIDTLGQTIATIYGRKAPVYAVYGANRRVMICFADDRIIEDEQRKLISQLAPLRGEIDGLIDGWRDGRGRSYLGSGVSTMLIDKANRYNRRVADALIVALEGDLVTAGQLLEAIKQEILKERTATARFEYLLTAMMTALAAIFVAWMIATTLPFAQEYGQSDPPSAHRTQIIGIVALLLGLAAAVGYSFLRATPEDGETGKPLFLDFGPLLYRQKLSLFLFVLFAIPLSAILLFPMLTSHMGQTYKPHDDELVSMWRGAGAGAVGAFFSIALGIRTRTVLPDLLRTSNLLDAALRVVIGLLSGAILLALFRLNVVHVILGTIMIDGKEMLGTIMIGFLAGFSERLVPDLLDKVNAQPGTPPQAPSIVRAAHAAEVEAAAAKKKEGARAAADTAAPAPDEPDPIPEESGHDCCAVDEELPDDLVTADADLPAASGGVAKADGGVVA